MSSSDAAATPALDLEGPRAFAAVASRMTGRPRKVRVGRYELQQQLGEGGLGAVFEAYDPELDRRVAIKLVKESAAGLAKARERLAAEARALAQLGHRNVVKVFDVGTNEIEGRTHLYIVMELLPGPTLSEWLEGERSVDEVLRVFAEAGRGLIAAHGVDVVHRDFKPSNVMLAADGRVVVLDFGLAYGDGTSSSSLGPSNSQPLKLTQTGVVMGTPAYMAPEQHDARPADERADQYAFCVALWGALQREPPFTGSTLTEIGLAKMSGPPPRPKTMSRALHRALATGLAVRRDARHASMADLLQALEPPRRTRMWVVGAVAIGILGGAAALSYEASPEVCGVDPSWSPRYDALVEAATPPRGSMDWGLQSRVAARLERFERRWLETQTSVCEAEQSPAVTRATAGACLQRASAAFERVLDLADGTAPIAQIELDVHSLPVPSRCVSAEAAGLFVDDEGKRQAELALAERIRSNPDDAELDRLMAEASALDNAWLSIRVQVVRSLNALRAGDPERARETLEQALWHAEDVDDHLLAAELLPGVINGLIDAGARPDRVRPWVDRGHRILEHAGDPPGLEARLLVVEALVDYQEGAPETAVAKFDRAFELVDHRPPPGSEGIFAYGKALSIAFRFDELPPEEVEKQAREVLALGDPADHWYPNIASMVTELLSEAAFSRGDYQTAIVSRVEQLGWVHRAVSGRSPRTWQVVGAHGQMLSLAGADEIGVPLMEHAYRELSEMPGTEVWLITLAGYLSEVHRQRRDHAEALRWVRRMVADQEAQYGVDNPDLFWGNVDRARSAAHVGALEEARASLKAARAVADQFNDSDRLQLELATGELAIADGRLEDAAAPLELVRDRTHPNLRDPVRQAERADACDGLIKVYAARGEDDRSRAMQECRDVASERAGPLRR